jgi:glycosyltransferase involved in cell wall biosynthesis
MTRTLISFPVDLVPQESGLWLSDVYMWKQLEGIQDYLDCDFLCLLPDGVNPKNCLIKFPSERVLSIKVQSARTHYLLKKATKLKNTLNYILEKRIYQNLVLFEPLPLNLYLAQIGHRRKMRIFSWFSGDYFHSGLATLRGSLGKQWFKILPTWIMKLGIFKYMTQVSRMVITDSPHLFKNCTKVFFAPSQTINREEISTLPKARVGEYECLSLLFVGRVVPLKGLHVLIEALAALSGSLQFHLTIVGPLYGREFGGYEYRLRRLIHETGLNSKVTLVGNVNDRRVLEQYYLQADVFVLPSFTEGTPKAMLEAMAYGLPVVASRVGGIPLVVRDGREGFLIEPGNINDLQANIRRMLANRNRLKIMGQLARERSFNYSKDCIFKNMAQEITAVR